MPEDRYTLGALAINTAGLSELEACLREWLRTPVREKRLVGFVNPHVYNIAERDVEVREFLKACDLVCVDGIGVALAFRFLCGQAVPRVVATRLFEQTLAWSGPAIKAVLIGGTQPQSQRAADAINARNGAWRIVKAFHGYADVEDYPAILAQYSDVDAVLVGAGSPKSEGILLHARQLCPKALCWHIGGGTVGIFAGSKARSPAWISAVGCEWMHRFIYEPHYRHRVFPGAFQFAGHLLKNRFFPKYEAQQ